MSDTWKDEHSEKKRCSTELKLINYGPFNVNNRSSHTRFLLSYFFLIHSRRLWHQVAFKNVLIIVTRFQPRKIYRENTKSINWNIYIGDRKKSTTRKVATAFNHNRSVKKWYDKCQPDTNHISLHEIFCHIFLCVLCDVLRRSASCSTVCVRMWVCCVRATMTTSPMMTDTDTNMHSTYCYIYFFALSLSLSASLSISLFTFHYKRIWHIFVCHSRHHHSQPHRAYTCSHAAAMRPTGFGGCVLPVCMRQRHMHAWCCFRRQQNGQKSIPFFIMIFIIERISYVFILDGIKKKRTTFLTLSCQFWLLHFQWILKPRVISLHRIWLHIRCEIMCGGSDCSSMMKTFESINW